jgi:FtsP/CotA-like multicopper oxidase with cupredoxin domain
LAVPPAQHLHGHRFQAVEIDRTRLADARRDRGLTPPGGARLWPSTQKNPWLRAFHRHLLYHMETGVFTTSSKCEPPLSRIAPAQLG